MRTINILNDQDYDSISDIKGRMEQEIRQELSWDDYVIQVSLLAISRYKGSPPISEAHMFNVRDYVVKCPHCSNITILRDRRYIWLLICDRCGERFFAVTHKYPKSITSGRRLTRTNCQVCGSKIGVCVHRISGVGVKPSFIPLCHRHLVAYKAKELHA